jgi:Sap, sulfolipid-1-addressing protein
MTRAAWRVDPDVGPALVAATEACARLARNDPAKLQKASTAKSQQGRVPAMWSSVLLMALLVSLDPVRFAFILLIVSRPRPVQNLLAYWIGCVIACVSILLVPLMVLHFTPTFTSFNHDLAVPSTTASSTVQYIQIGVGVLALVIAALMAVRVSARRRAPLPAAGGNTSTLVLDPDTPTATSRLQSRALDAATESESAILRLPGRIRNAWENGSLWVAFVIGLLSGPPPSPLLFVLTTIATGSAVIGTQVSAVIAFVIVMLAVVEIILVSYLAAPAKTEAVLQRVHDWVQPYRRQIVAGIFALAGVMLVAKGMAII